MNRIVFKNNVIDLDIKKGPCKYVGQSAIGKTYFPYVASRFKDFPAIVVVNNSATYSKLNDGSIWSYGDDSIYFFDRFDLYYSDSLMDFIMVRKDYCSIIDLKSCLSISPQYLSEIELIDIKRPSANKWEVKSAFLFGRQGRRL